MIARNLAPSMRVDFPVSGENVREADKRGAGPAGLAKIFDFRLGECHKREQNSLRRGVRRATSLKEGGEGYSIP